MKCSILRLCGLMPTFLEQHENSTDSDLVSVKGDALDLRALKIGSESKLTP